LVLVVFGHLVILAADEGGTGPAATE
jgi:hypothetical protein